jgi:hypothetical protein
MSALYNHDDYAIALSIFNSSPKTGTVWSVFKNVHMAVSKNKCPICECPLDNSVVRDTKNGTTTLSPTIDHYRPKDGTLYPNLKHDHENYILMCSDCNNAYKGNRFPLHSSTPIRNTSALKTSEITDEKPLIVNPILDNVFDLFKIALKQTPSGKKVLELSPKQTDGYMKEKAEETIRVFSLGNCEDINHTHSNTNVQSCRINLLHHHYVKFFTIISVLKGRKLHELARYEQIKVFRETNRLKLRDYGFFDSIMQCNYIDLIN